MTDLNADSTYFLELQTQTGWGKMLTRFVDWCQPARGWRTLDVGTGPGLLPALLSQKGCRALGVDLDPGMFAASLHPNLALADANRLPFPETCFDLVTASNVLFLLPNPVTALGEMARVACGQVAVLNPSEQMNLATATALADKHNLQGLARDTLLNLGRRAEKYHHWSESDLAQMFATVGLEMQDTTTRMGPGLIRFAKTTPSSHLRIS